MSDEYDSLMKWQKKFVDTILEDLKHFPRLRKRGTICAGPPGTGKTHGSSYLCKVIKREFPELRVEVAATTGAAASRLGGDAKTLATWMSIGMDSMKLHHKDEMIRLIKQRNPERLRNTDVLILDEVSMLSKRQFDNLNDLLREIRQDPRPFGGMYVILIGDPFQLPPVPHDGGGGILRKQKEFIESCLETEIDGFNYIVANEMKRSEGDKLLQRLLLCLISKNPEERKEAVVLLRKHCYRDQMEIDDVLDEQERTGAIILCTQREGDYSVDAYNKAAEERAREFADFKEIEVPPAKRLHTENSEVLKAIGGKTGLDVEEETICSRDGWTTSAHILANTPCMIRKNMKTREGVSVVNGDMCHVLEIDKELGYAKVRLLRDNSIVHIPKTDFRSEWASEIGYEAYPFIPCAAMTVHKAQGATLSKGIIYESRTLRLDSYMAHMLYTAFSRVKKISDIRITSYIVDDQLEAPPIQKKIDYIWKLSFMDDYLRPSDL
jgi:ATP-dependent exoDNAse (exonuclease V) alpha subunit